MSVRSDLEVFVKVNGEDFEPLLDYLMKNPVKDYEWNHPWEGESTLRVVFYDPVSAMLFKLTWA